jgi:hypothetical protein
MPQSLVARFTSDETAQMVEFDTGVGRCEVQLALECRHCDRTPIQGRTVWLDRQIGMSEFDETPP